MDEKKRRRLQSRGWKTGDAKELLGLSPAEQEYIDMKIGFGGKLREIRLQRGMTQEQLARAIGSSQSRVARMEAGDPSVSLDLLVRSLLTLGISCGEIAETMTSTSSI